MKNDNLVIDFKNTNICDKNEKVSLEVIKGLYYLTETKDIFKDEDNKKTNYFVLFYDLLALNNETLSSDEKQKVMLRNIESFKILNKDFSGKEICSLSELKKWTDKMFDVHKVTFKED